MANYVETAQQFGDLLAKEDYASAFGLLTKEAQTIYSPNELERRSGGMRTYAPGPINDVEVMVDFILEDWPAKREGDVASIYVALSGDGFCEGVGLIMAQEGGGFRIRDIEWGRP